MIGRRPRFTTIRQVDRRADIGDIARRELVLLPNKWLIFRCPCDTGHEVHLNMDVQRHPSWTLDPANISVRPSVIAAGPERRCHYFIVGGRVRACPDDRTTSEPQWRLWLRSLIATIR
ncbi:DUF6527 family protein [Ilumatobacter sp.]|uniref:DUF6527 family protein n=1 Tax=Ilumatobacter sp. TaxID=1967498 RepID=UPI00345CE596